MRKPKNRAQFNQQDLLQNIFNTSISVSYYILMKEDEIRAVFSKKKLQKWKECIKKISRKNVYVSSIMAGRSLQSLNGWLANPCGRRLYKPQKKPGVHIDVEGNLGPSFGMISNLNKANALKPSVTMILRLGAGTTADDQLRSPNFSHKAFQELSNGVTRWGRLPRLITSRNPIPEKCTMSRFRTRFPW